MGKFIKGIFKMAENKGQDMSIILIIHITQEILKKEEEKEKVVSNGVMDNYMMANGKTERSKEVGCGKDQKAFHMLENGILTLSKALEFYLKKTQDTKGNSKIT